jgi:peptide/nickel transport system substrate-binding protein
VLRRRLLTLPVVAALLLTACGQAATRLPSSITNQDRILTVAIGVDADTMDPMRQTTTTVQNMVDLVVEELVTLNAQGQIVPQLATSWQQSADGLTWTFTLRQGVHFSDGEPFNSEAVKANLERVIDPTNLCPICGTFPSYVAGISTPDQDHVQIQLNKPLASQMVLGVLALTTYGILAPNTIRKGTPEYKDQEHPIGTGPYIYAGRVKGDHLTFVRNPHYWGKEPYYQEQVFKVVPDAAVREALVRSGQAQVIVSPPAADLPQLEQDRSLQVLLAPDDRTIFLSIDTQDSQQPLLQKVQVRQALNYAINKEAIVKDTLFGAAVPETAPVAQNLFGYCKMPNQYDYNPTKARQLLQQAGAEGMTIKLSSPTGRYIQDIQAAQDIANYLRDVGINVEGPTTMDWPTYVATLNVPLDRATMDVALLGWAPGYLDASQSMVLFDSALMPPKGLNTSYYNNPQVDSLIQEAATQTNTQVRAQEYCQAEQMVWNDAPWVFLWVQRYPIVYSKTVTNVSYNPTEMFNTVYARPA